MFWCWIKAVLLAVSVVGTIIGALAALIAALVTVIWLGDKVSDFTNEHMPKASVIGWGAAKVIGVILFATFVIGGVFAAKEKVCMVGFKTAYVDTMKHLTNDDSATQKK